jgi:gliding motility-associated-like protein
MRLLKSIFIILFVIGGFNSVGQETDHDKGIYKFIKNKGQWPQGVQYKAESPAGAIWLENQGVLYQFKDFSNLEAIHHGHDHDAEAALQSALIYMQFEGANLECEFSQKHATTEYYSFFKGQDESKWASGLKGYGHVSYKNLYSGIDMIMLEEEGELKYEFHVAPSADPSEIKLSFKGQDKMKIRPDGSLQLKTSLGELIEDKPYVYQVKNGKIVEIEASFKLDKNVISYELGDYDESLELIIDPVLVFATYCGSDTDNFGMTATYAYTGEAYSAGITFGSDYPTPGPAWNVTSTIPELNAQANQAVQYGVTDVFVSKYSSDGTQMLWTCILGGGTNLDGTETVHSLICDTLNNIYLYGATSSQDFPMMNAFQSLHGGGIAGANFTGNGTYFLNNGTDIYVSKLSADGLSLMGSTYVGGNGNDGLNNNALQNNDSLTTNYGDQFRGEIMLDSMNNVLIGSSTNSTNFPTSNSFQSTPVGGQDGVVFKLSADFSTMLWSTYYGGTDNDACYSVKIDSSYNIIIAGGTSSIDLPSTAGALTTTYQGGETDGYVAKISPDGSTLVRTSYIGTNDYDQAFFIEVDRWDNVYLLGQSNGNMPVVNAVYSNPNSGQFIMKLEPDLDVIDYSTVFGSGSGVFDISPAAFLVDVCGNAYCTGWSGITGPPMSGMPITTDAFQSTPPTGNDFYLFVLERDAEDVLYGSYIGSPGAGEHVDGGTSRFDKYGVVYQSVCGGCGADSDFPTTTGAWSSTNDALNCNNLVFKFDFELIPDADFELSSFEGCAPFTLILDNESNDTVNSVWTFPPEAIVVNGGVNPELLFNDPGTYEIIISITDTICNLVDTAKKVVTVYEELQLDILGLNDTVVCAPFTQDLTADSQGSAISFTWSDDPTFTNVLNAGVMDSVITISPTTTTTYYLTATNGWPDCDLVDSVVVQFVDGGAELVGVDSMCLGDTLALEAHNLIQGVQMDYTWTPNLGIVTVLPGDSIAIVSPPSSQWYYLTAVTNLGCTIYDSIFINVSYIDPADVLAVANPDTIPEGGTSVLTAFPAGFNYVWSPDEFLNTSLGQTVTATLDETTTFEVTISGNGCEAKTPVTVYTREFICGDIYIFVPSAFTPNGDNENDILYVRGDNLLEVDLKIFDRWGELMFETTDQGIGWDGTFKGEPVDPDVYVYHLQAICFDGQESLIKGNITVLK